MYGHTSLSKPEQGTLQTESHCQALWPKLLRICRTGCTPGRASGNYTGMTREHMAPHAHTFSYSLTKVALSSIDRRQTLRNALLRHALNTQYTLSALRCSASKPRSRCLSRPCSSKASTETTSHDDVTSCSCHCQHGPLPLNQDLSLSPRRALPAGNHHHHAD